MKKSTEKNQKVNFYKKNQKVIHHLFNIPLFFGIMCATGNTEFVTQPVFILLGLTVCYFTTSFVIKVSDSI
jgi:hypothetical protein